MPLSPTNTARILIAAEAPLEALALDTMLRDSGQENVRVTSDAREIMPLHEKWPFVLLVLDMGMRSLGGLGVLAQMHGRIDQHQMAVLALTDGGDTLTQEHALNFGAADIIERSYTQAETLARVARALAALPGPSVDDVVLRAVSKRFAPAFG